MYPEVWLLMSELTEQLEPSLNDLLSHREIVIHQLNRLKEAEDIEHKLGAVSIEVAPETLLKRSGFHQGCRG